MLVRQPVVAGRFYPGQKDILEHEIETYTREGKEADDGKMPWAVMLPHAGYIFCGGVIGKTLAGQQLPPRLVVLCPNHTGRGKMLGVWPDGAWLTPLGPIAVDTAFAAELLKSDGGFEADTLSHLGEHSIEVILPFLQEQTTNLSITPICVGTQNPAILENAGKALAKILKLPQNSDVGIVVSSDMNHYENEKNTFAKDELALAKACAADPAGLLQVVNREKISMCGAGPMALVLYAAKEMGGVEVELVAHDTSAKASGDYEHTVGYAGLRLYLGGN